MLGDVDDEWGGDDVGLADAGHEIVHLVVLAVVVVVAGRGCYCCGSRILGHVQGPHT